MRSRSFLLLAGIAAAPVASHSAADLGIAGKEGLVVCTSAPACDAGASVLARGGNAVDAAIATAFALAVTHPSAGNIGGGGFMIARTPDGQVTAFDYRERAPLRSTRTMYLGTGTVLDQNKTVGLPKFGFVRDLAQGVHYDGTKDEDLWIEIAGMGPATSITYEPPK